MYLSGRPLFNHQIPSASANPIVGLELHGSRLTVLFSSLLEYSGPLLNGRWGEGSNHPSGDLFHCMDCRRHSRSAGLLLELLRVSLLRHALAETINRPRPGRAAAGRGLRWRPFTMHLLSRTAYRDVLCLSRTGWPLCWSAVSSAGRIHLLYEGCSHTRHTWQPWSQRRPSTIHTIRPGSRMRSVTSLSPKRLIRCTQSMHPVDAPSRCTYT
ncbi:hypothetical protein J3F83DRAFT_247161 [Trichoderma novae-zelandiae]